MPPTIHLKSTAERTPEESAELRSLTREVYPPHDREAWEGDRLQWAPSEIDIMVRDEDGALVSYVGIITRLGLHNDNEVTIGGIGGVKTHPEFRGRGHAAVAIDEAIGYLRSDDVPHALPAAFGLLVCNESLLGYYNSIGWQLFEGTLITQQRGAPEVFEFNRVMVTSIAKQAPRDGRIDLKGPPW